MIYKCRPKNGTTSGLVFMEKNNFEKNRRKTNGRRREWRQGERFVSQSNAVFGRNAVLELIKSGAPIDKVLVAGREGSVKVIIAEARTRGIPVVDSSNDALDRMTAGGSHQGVAALTAEKEYSTVEDILKSAREKDEKPLLVICDGVEDPHNLGAIIRSAECAGAHGVIIPERRSCGLTPTVSKASAGALAHMMVAKVVNISQCIDKLKEDGVWIFAAEADGTDFYETDWDMPCAIVMGGEDSGVSRLVREKCDFVVSIPMFGKLNSLNVSAAAAVLLCHAARVQKIKKNR